MGNDSKALLAHSKALADRPCNAYDKAMLSTSERMAEKLKTALNTKGMGQKAFAEACGVSKQAAQSWVKTGRVDKKHLPKFIEIFGYPLEWWLDTNESTSPPSIQACETDRAKYKLNVWPFTSISQRDYSQLSERQMGMVEGFIKGLLHEAPPAKSNGTIGP